LHGATTQADHLGGLEDAGPLGKFAAGGLDLPQVGVGTAEALANPACLGSEVAVAGDRIPRAGKASVDSRDTGDALVTYLNTASE
jgi:hypothetical protein